MLAGRVGALVEILLDFLSLRQVDALAAAELGDGTTETTHVLTLLAVRADWGTAPGLRPSGARLLAGGAALSRGGGAEAGQVGARSAL
ncbi:hypothetical protein DAERI_260012 [Deinococcus aerius]|uniref:Uncharacterized protein n=1 Tax=Deinococcus aerius TaxID=200253 RepID=A0A2I9DBY0_9DEIO|nr:hypothetical protein DAERI_260012 [Deinococcus aerius]